MDILIFKLILCMLTRKIHTFGNQVKTQKYEIKINIAESCKYCLPFFPGLFCTYPGVFDSLLGGHRHQGCVHSFLWIFECYSLVKLNNQRAGYLAFILLTLIELNFFKFYFGCMSLREITTRDSSRKFVTHLRLLWLRM